jgi:hypothetical protein
MEATRRATISRRLWAVLPLLVNGFAFSGLRLAILAIPGRSSTGLNVGVTVALLVILVALTHPRIQAWELSLLRHAL